MQLRIFFSHAWADKERATLKFLQNRLKEHFDVKIHSREIDIGEAIEPEILEGVRNCGVYLIAWSKAAEASKAIQLELQAATGWMKRIVVCVIDGHPADRSPVIRDLRQSIFNGDPVSDEAEWLHLNDLLLSAGSEASAGGTTIEEGPGGPDAIDTELEDLLYRYRERIGGNDGQPIRGVLDEFVRLFGADEDRKMRLFAEAAQAISEQYPPGKDDQRRQLLLLQAVINIDPEQSEPELLELRRFLEQQRSLDLRELREAREKAVMQTVAGTAGSPMVRAAFQQLAGRKLIAMQSSSSGSDDSYSGSSDVVHLQLLADGHCRFRLVRSNYANHFGTVRDEQEEEGSWELLEENGRLYLYFTWKNNTPEKLALVIDATNELLLNNVRYGIFDLNYEV